MLGYVSLAVLLVAGVSCSAVLKSPCPGKFEYTSQNETGLYEGTLNVQAEYTLHGLWIRLFFDQAPKAVKILDGFGEVVSIETEPKAYLIKNREHVLKKNVPLKVRFAVSYETSAPPSLIGYRLNARDVCPEEQD